MNLICSHCLGIFMLHALEIDQNVCSLRKQTLSFDANITLKWAFCIGLAIISSAPLTQIINLDRAYKCSVTYCPIYKMRITIFNFKVLLGSIDDNIFRRKKILNTTFMCLDRKENHIPLEFSCKKNTPQK